MSKVKKAVIGILSICCLLALTGCGAPSSKTGMDVAAFETKMNEEHYAVEDLTENLSSIDGMQKALKVQSEEQPSVTIRFYSFEQNDQAKAYYDQLIQGYGQESPNKEKSLEGENYVSYQAEFKDMHNTVVVSQVDNNIIYVIGDTDDDIDEEELVESFGF